MEKELFNRYVIMLNNFEDASKEGNSIIPNEAEKKVMQDVKNLVSTDPELKSLLLKIHKSKQSERMELINNHFGQEITQNHDEQLTDEKVQEPIEIKKETEYVKSSKYGFIDGVLYFSAASFVILLIGVLYYLIKYYL